MLMMYVIDYRKYVVGVIGKYYMMFLFLWGGSMCQAEIRQVNFLLEGRLCIFHDFPFLEESYRLGGLSQVSRIACRYKSTCGVPGR